MFDINFPLKPHTNHKPQSYQQLVKTNKNKKPLKTPQEKPLKNNQQDTSPSVIPKTL